MRRIQHTGGAALQPLPGNTSTYRCFQMVYFSPTGAGFPPHAQSELRGASTSNVPVISDTGTSGIFEIPFDPGRSNPSTTALMHYNSEIQRLEGSIRTLKADRQSFRIYTSSVPNIIQILMKIQIVKTVGMLRLYITNLNPTPSTYISSPEALGTLAKQDLLQLSQVCTLWHDLITGTPALWSEIGIIGIYWSGEHLKGRLHSLQEITLSVHSWPGLASTGTNVFEDAPRLTQVYFPSPPWISGLPRLPWGQLRSFTCADTGTYGFLDVMRNLSAPNATFTLRNFHPYGDPPHLPPITSHISSFSLEMQMFNTVCKSWALFIDRHRGEIWPVDQFEPLSMRSSFHNTLHSLDQRIRIAEDELLRSLASLASLKSLTIADQPAISVDGKIEQIDLITNSLLLRLTWTPSSSDTCPIPRLSRFRCITRFQFNPRVYRDFLASRIALNGAPFEASIRGHLDADTSKKQEAAVMKNYFEPDLLNRRLDPPTELSKTTRQHGQATERKPCVNAVIVISRRCEEGTPEVPKGN
ncbi:hypothetical protein GGX14DRAFT_654333 [Mycena pura]|uniref:F-box domain-containing protein n=1 Tax=Mycena pura TaxID=153505 RepID=A0AAD6VBF7_9AGAR|nr:hypothetical protein GGX14DRAFT_654333 [Mycena pura]